MHMIVDDTRQDKTARSIYELVIGCFGRMGFCVNLSNLGILDEDGALKESSFVYQRTALNQRSHFCGMLREGAAIESATCCWVSGTTCVGAAA